MFVFVYLLFDINKIFLCVHVPAEYDTFFDKWKDMNSNRIYGNLVCLFVAVD